MGAREGDSATTVPAEHLRNMSAHDRDGVLFGEVADLYIDPESDQVLYLAVDSGGFAGRRHLVPATGVYVTGRGTSGRAQLPYDREHLTLGPTFEPGADVTLGDESDVLEHFGFEGYEDVLRMRQAPPAPTPQIAEAELDQEVRSGRDPLGVRLARWEA